MLLLLLLSHFSRVQLCATAQMGAHHAPPSLEFSRQEHWSGLPFPSPMHGSEVAVMSDSATPWSAAYQDPLSIGFSRQEYWSGVPLPSLPIAHITLNYQRSNAFPFEIRNKRRIPTPVFLPGESQGWGRLVGCRLCGRTELDTTEVT